MRYWISRIPEPPVSSAALSVTATASVYQPSSPSGAAGSSVWLDAGAVWSSGNASWPERSGTSKAPPGSSSVSAIR